MTVYLFAGDSLTEGIYGESYVERVAKGLYLGRAGLEGKTISSGRSGDTVLAVLDRIDEPLHQYQPDWVILAVGINDVWLPWLTARSFVWWLWSGYRRFKMGQKPLTDLDQFAAAYRALIDKSQQTAAHVLVCTVPPVGEKLSSPFNQHLARLNGTIKHVAADHRVPVADVWQAYIEELAALPKPSGYTPGEWLFTSLDRQRLRSTTPDEIARRRRLHLTFDGLHLNSQGAKLWADTILTALAQAQGSAVTSPPLPVQQLGLLCFRQEHLQVCCTPGWQVRARDVAQLLADAYQHLAKLTDARPLAWLGVLTQVHWEQLARSLPYPVPAIHWQDTSSMLLVPDSYPQPFLHEHYLPETVSAWHRWPSALAEVGEPARITALADLLAVQELARLFLYDLRVAPTDPLLNHLLATYLTEVVLHSREAEGATEMADLWDAWGTVLAENSAAEGQTRLQAQALFEAHGDSLVASFIGSEEATIRELHIKQLETGEEEV